MESNLNDLSKVCIKYPDVNKQRTSIQNSGLLSKKLYKDYRALIVFPFSKINQVYLASSKQEPMKLVALLICTFLSTALSSKVLSEYLSRHKNNLHSWW